MIVLILTIWTRGKFERLGKFFVKNEKVVVIGVRVLAGIGVIHIVVEGDNGVIAIESVFFFYPWFVIVV